MERKNGSTTGFLDHSDQPQCHMNMSFGNDAYQIKMTHVTADCTTPGSVDHSDQPQCHMNTSFANDAPQKQPQSHMNTSFGNDANQKQILAQHTWEVDYVPKLIRTKSVIMKDTNHLDSSVVEASHCPEGAAHNKGSMESTGSDKTEGERAVNTRLYQASGR
uniref:Uncharacterized protein n=1 Tax=Knipowitschia caucasica TaxID=637954 RepID=A0AAV2M6C2_KNICA